MGKCLRSVEVFFALKSDNFQKTNLEDQLILCHSKVRITIKKQNCPIVQVTSFPREHKKTPF